MCVCVCLCLCMLVSPSYLTLFSPMDYSPPGSSVQGILQARILERDAIPSFKGFSWPRGQTQVSWIAGRFFSIWVTREAHDTENSIVKSHASIARFDTCQQFPIFLKKQSTGRVEPLISLSILLFFPSSNDLIVKLAYMFFQLLLAEIIISLILFIFFYFKFHINNQTVHILQLAFACSIIVIVYIFIYIIVMYSFYCIIISIQYVVYL